MRGQRLCALAGSGYPDYTLNGKWKLEGFANWTAGYFAGMLWLMYGETRDPVWLERTRRWTGPIGAFRHDNRDLNFGLSFMPTFVAGCRLTGEPGYKQFAFDAASAMAQRYISGGKYIRSWGTVGGPREQEFIIVHCLIDLDLLYWAAQQTGEKRCFDICGLDPGGDRNCPDMTALPDEICDNSILVALLQILDRPLHVEMKD